MTEEEKETFIRVAIAGLTQGLQHPLEWLASYCRGFHSIQTPSENALACVGAAKAYAALYNETAPHPTPLTPTDIDQMVGAYYKRCCFPGCYTEGEFKVTNLENTSLTLCHLHKDCLHGPAPEADQDIPPEGVR